MMDIPLGNTFADRVLIYALLLGALILGAHIFA